MAEQLKKSILQYAMQGKLVPQDPNDEPVSVLLEKIKEEKEQLINDKVIKREKELPLITDEEIPFDIPDSWKWVRLGDLGITQTGVTPSTNSSEYYGDYIPFIKPGDMFDNYINYDNQKLSEKGIEKGRLIPKNSVLMVCIGGSRGKCYYTDRDVSCNQQINTITPYGDLVNFKYVYFILISSYLRI